MPRKKKNTKRANGEGSIYYDETKKRYIAAITVGYDQETGKPIRTKVSAKTQAEVLEKMHKMEMERSLGVRLDADKVTVGEWLDRWMSNYMKKKLRATIYPSYQQNIRLHVKPYIGDMPLKSLQTDDLQSLFNHLLENGRDKSRMDKATNPGLSRRTVEYVRAILRKALKKAKETKLILNNPVEGTELPPKIKTEVIPYAREDVEKFLNSTIYHRLFAAYYLAFHTGLRMGEMLGLMWKDINFLADSFEVQRELECIRDEETGKQYLDFQPPKTPKSQRIIPMVEELVKVLKAHKVKQNKEKLFFGAEYYNEDLVFCTEDGKRIWPRNFDRQYHNLLQKAGVDPKNFHATRHTFASRLIEAGEDIRNVQELLGHVMMSTTSDIYTHVIERSKRKAVEKLNGMYNIKIDEPDDSVSQGQKVKNDGEQRGSNRTAL